MQVFKLFFRLHPYIKIRWKWTAFAYLCNFIRIAMVLAQPFLFSYLIDQVLIEKRTSLLLPILLTSLGLAACAIVLNIVRAGIFRNLGIRHTLDLREVVLAHIRKLPLYEIEKVGVGKYTALMGMDTATMGNFLNHIVVEMTAQWFTMIIAVSMIFYMDVRLGILTLIAVPLLMVVPAFFRKPLAKYAGHVRTHNEEVGTSLQESIRGSREIRAFGLENWEKARNDAFYKGLVASSTRETLMRVVSGQTGTLLISAIVVLLYAIGSDKVLEGTTTIGMLVAAVQYLNNALNPIQVMNDFYGEMQRQEVAMIRIEQFLKSPVEQAASVPESNEAPVRPALVCSNLRVSCDGVDILKGVDLNVEPGQKVAFVGNSGSGKTTLFRTLLGFMPVSSGSVLLDGMPLEALSRPGINGVFGAVFQESFIFAGTLYENIAIGNLEATLEEVEEAARMAGLKSYVESLPDGLHTWIDQQGFQLSGGQRQRVAIARALLKKPDILILDEPTSALDRETEYEVLSSIMDAMRERTVLLSTHRIETVKSADVICVMDQGKVIDCGKHDELMVRCGKYASLVREQAIAYPHGVTV